MKKLSVIYIAGDGRSGSTILDRVLGTLDGVISLNEIYRVWLEGFIVNNFCPCGKRFKECAFWNEVIREALGESIDVKRLWALHNAVDHTRYCLKLLTGISKIEYKAKLAEYREVLKRLYFAIAKVSNTDIIVDSSKVPSRALVLNGIPGIEVSVIHLVRDARAVVYAWDKRRKYNPASGKELVQHKPFKTISTCIMRNFFSEMLSLKLPYVRIRYEDFAVHPREVTQSVVDRLEPLSGKKVNFVDRDSIELEVTHSMGGNPTRFSSGLTKIRLDEKWKKNIDPKTRFITTLLCWPLFLKYGYL